MTNIEAIYDFETRQGDIDTVMSFLNWLDEAGIELVWKSNSAPVLNQFDLILQHFDIDKRKLDRERREILKQYRQMIEA